MINKPKQVLICAFFLVLTGCVSSEFTTGSIDQRREAIIGMREVALREFYTTIPSLQEDVANADGYAVFSDSRALVGVANIGNDVGVVRDNATGNDIFMARKNRAVGIGLGKTDRDMLIIFNTESALSEFLLNGSLDISETSGEVAIYSHNIDGLRLGLGLNIYEHYLDNELN